MNNIDMLFLVQDYLRGLKERDELDAILPDLLRAMGMEIVKLAFRGEVEHGVDIAAVSEEDDETVLYLIQVKSGDIDKSLWDSGPNAVRPTLNNLLDVPFKDLTQERLQQARKKAILAHNGLLRENVRERFNGYIDSEFRPRMEFDRWDLDTLARWFHEYLLSERLFPEIYQRLLKRTLVFLDVPDYDLSDFKELMSEILPNIKRLRKPRRIRIFGAVRLMLTMITKQCQDPDSDNLSPAIIAYEHALLSLWNWMRQHDFFGRPVQEEFSYTYLLYIDLLLSWVEKVEPALRCPDGLVFGGTSEQIEYPMRTFHVIGNLGLLTSAIAYMPQTEDKQGLLEKTLELLVKTVQNNAARHRPLLDNHSVDIFLGMWPLLLLGETEFVRWWLQDILEHLAIRKRFHGRLLELTNNIDAVIEYEATGRKPITYTDSSSMLVYMLFEICLLVDAEDLYLAYRETFADVSLQVWYPPENVETTLYSREVFEGDTEVIQRLPSSFEEFRLDVQARHQFDRTDYSPIEKGFPIILLLANKHFHTPVFPFWWRGMLFSASDEEDLENIETRNGEG